MLVSFQITTVLIEDSSIITLNPSYSGHCTDKNDRDHRLNSSRGHMVTSWTRHVLVSWGCMGMTVSVFWCLGLSGNVCIVSQNTVIGYRMLLMFVCKIGTEGPWKHSWWHDVNLSYLMRVFHINDHQFICLISTIHSNEHNFICMVGVHISITSLINNSYQVFKTMIEMFMYETPLDSCMNYSWYDIHLVVVYDQWSYS